MIDTSPQIEKIMRERLMARTGEERLVMGSEMFEAAREMIRASLPRGLSETEKKRLLCERIYGKVLAPF